MNAKQAAKARAKTRNTIRRSGKDPLGLLKVVKYTIREKVMVSDRLTMMDRLSSAKFGKLSFLNEIIDNSWSESARIAAAKERRGMFKPACKDVIQNSNGYMKGDQTFRDLELTVKRRYLK